MKVDSFPIDKVVPYDRNPRKNAGAVRKVAASLDEFGWRQPMVVDAEMVIVVGHTRWLAAKQLGMSEVPVHSADGLSPEQIRAYRIADNRTNEEAEWDLDLLAAELGDLESLGISLDTTGFDDDELRKLLGEGEIDISVENDESGSGTDNDYLRFGTNKIPIADEELEALDRLLKQYVSENSLNHGFARWLCEGRDSA